MGWLFLDTPVRPVQLKVKNVFLPELAGIDLLKMVAR